MSLRTRRAAAVLALATPLAFIPFGTAQAADDAQVSVLHAIPGLTVDVYVNGDLTLDNFKPGDLAGPLALPADTYSIEITDKDDKQTVLLGPADVAVKAGGNYTVVANLDAKGDPTVTPFENDISSLSAGEARVTVRHVAAAPKVDIEANGDVLATLVNGKEAVAVVPADTYDVGIVPASGGQAVWNENVELAEGVNTIAYAWGSLDDDSFAVTVQTIDGLHSAPGAVNAGEVGLAGTGTDGSSPWLIAALVGSVLVGSAAAVRLAQARR